MFLLRIGLFLILVGLGSGGGCSREEPAAPGPRVSNTNSHALDDVSPDDFQSSVPREGGPAGYVGSAACQVCHQDQFKSWHRTYHRTMTQFATPQTVQANFNQVTLTNDTTRFLLSCEGQELRVRMERILDSASSGEPAPALDTRVSLVTGSHHMQVFWVPAGDGNVQVGFPFTWLIPEQRWVPRNSTFIRPPGFAHQAEVWNIVCSRCHSTAIEPRVDPVQRRMDSRAAELGISCEACHGPGESHVAARTAAGPLAPKPDASLLAQEIVHPEKIDPVRSAEICGFCHSMKWIDRSENWRKDGFRFRPGDALATTTPLIQPGQVESVPGLRDYLARNPALLDDYFWRDGMGRVSGREFNSVAESPCFQGGQFSCLSCHSLHESEPADLLAVNRADNRACTQCHEGYREPEALQRHTHHLATSSGSDCYNCHMPHTTYGVLTAIRSHQISSPRVATELATGRPNACNLCHLDQSLGWTADNLTEWFGQSNPDLDSATRSVSDAVRLSLVGDAGQRALLAWHFGWEPARRASGTNWIPPVLGILLDDPYAAVRCVADRSLRLTPEFRPAGYDFVVDPANRRPARESVWSLWMDSFAGSVPILPSGVLVRPGPAPEHDERINTLLKLRDDRPMRLRE